MRRRIGLLLLLVAGTVLAAFSSLGAANPYLGGKPLRSDARAIGRRRNTRPDARLQHDRVPTGRQDRPRSEAARPARGGRGREEVERRQQPPAEPGLLLLPAGRDVDLDQPDEAAEPPRRGERLPAGHRLVRLLRVDRQRQQLVRRDHPVPVDAGDDRATSTAILPSGGDPVTAFDRDGIAYYAQIAFNRYNDTSGVFVQRSTNGGFTWSRACVADQRRIADGRRRGLRRARRSAPAGRRHGVVQPRTTDSRPERQRRRSTTRSG